MAFIELENGTFVEVPDEGPVAQPKQGVRAALNEPMQATVSSYNGNRLYTGPNPMDYGGKPATWTVGDVPPAQSPRAPRAVMGDLTGIPENIRKVLPTLRAAQANPPPAAPVEFNQNLRDALARGVSSPQGDMFGGYDPELAQRPAPFRSAPEPGWQGGMNRWSDLQEAARRGDVYGDVSRNQTFDFRPQAELDAEAAAKREAWRQTNKPVAQAGAEELRQTQADVRANRAPPAGPPPEGPPPAQTAGAEPPPRQSLLDRVLNRTPEAQSSPVEPKTRRTMADRVASLRGEPGGGKSPGQRIADWKARRAEVRAAKPKVSPGARAGKAVSTMAKGGLQVGYGLLLDSAIRQDTPYNLANAQTVDDVVRIKGATDAERKAAYDAEMARASREGERYRPFSGVLAQERYGLRGENQGQETKGARQANLASDYVLAHQFETFQLLKDNPELYNELDENEKRLMDDATRYSNNPTWLAGGLNTLIGAGRNVYDLGRAIGEGAGWVAEQAGNVNAGGVQANANVRPPPEQAGPPRNTQAPAADAQLEEAIRQDEINRGQGRPDASPPGVRAAAAAGADAYTQNLAREVGGDAAKLTPVKGLKGIYRTTDEAGRPVFVGASDRAKKAATDPALKQQMGDERYREGLRTAFNTEKYLAALQGRPFETNLADYMSSRGILPTEADLNVEQRKAVAEAQKLNAEAGNVGKPTQEEQLAQQRHALNWLKAFYPNPEDAEELQKVVMKFGSVRPEMLQPMLQAHAIVRDLQTSNYYFDFMNTIADWFGETPDTTTAEQTYDFVSRLARAAAQGQKTFVDEKNKKSFSLDKLRPGSIAQLKEFDRGLRGAAQP